MRGSLQRCAECTAKRLLGPVYASARERSNISGWPTVQPSDAAIDVSAVVVIS